MSALRAKAAFQKVLLLIASANRDESRWERPDRLEITRRVAGHIAFGTGIHGCVGQIVARIEGEAVRTGRPRSVDHDSGRRRASRQHRPARAQFIAGARRGEMMFEDAASGRETLSRIIRQDCANQALDVLERNAGCPNGRTVLQQFPDDGVRTLPPPARHRSQDAQAPRLLM